MYLKVQSHNPVEIFEDEEAAIKLLAEQCFSGNEGAIIAMLSCLYRQWVIGEEGEPGVDAERIFRQLASKGIFRKTKKIGQIYIPLPLAFALKAFRDPELTPEEYAAQILNEHFDGDVAEMLLHPQVFRLIPPDLDCSEITQPVLVSTLGASIAGERTMYKVGVEATDL